jgi:elongation factor Ts
MKVSVDAVKELRNMTSASVMDCRKALTEAAGDIKKAMDLLRRRGLEIAAKKGERAAKEGKVEAYVHLGSKIGVLVEVNCETDFVARNNDFCQFTKDIAMQIAACNPSYIKREDVPEDVLAHYQDKEQFFKEKCLMEQAFIKDPSLAIKDYLTNVIAKLGENTVIRRFTRYKIGE